MPGLHIRVFGLVLARIAGMFVIAPFFDSKMVTTKAKAALVFWLAISIMYVLPVSSDIPEMGLTYVVNIFSSFLIGVLIGFFPKLIFTGIQFAGSLMDMQMGLSVAQSFDPLSGSQSTIVSRLMQLIALVLFMDINGHHLLLSAVFHSFKVIPIGGVANFPATLDSIFVVVTQMFYMGVQIASPIILVIFLLDFSFGLISRVAPQVNVFMLGFQMKPSLGLTIFMLLLPLLTSRVLFYLEKLIDQVYGVLVISSTG